MSGEKAMATGPQAILDREPMSRLQWCVVAVMMGLNALDGFDVLSISFASPGIARDWGIDRAALGIVLSMELVGMAAGSLLLGSLADRIGRRATILLCLMVMATGMGGVSTADGIAALCGWRVVTGLGIGGMLAATNAAVAEAANARRRSLAVVLMATGYPLGAIVGGSIAAMLLAHHDWPVVFRFGAIVTLAFVPLVFWFVPESIGFLLLRRPIGTLARINATLRRMRHGELECLPPPGPPSAHVPIARLFAPPYVVTTMLLTIAYLAHIMTFYFILKWIPKLVVDMGFPAASAAAVLVWANVGGALGSLGFGLLTDRWRLLPLTIGAMLLSVALVVWFGRGGTSLWGLSATAAAVGLCTNAGVVGLYALIAGNFATEVRASATGFVIGVGRGGSALAPALAGMLFAAGQGLQVVAALMAMGSLIAALALVMLGRAGIPARS